MFDLIVIGAGIAGMTASIYARRAGKKVLLLEEKNYGGQIVNSNSVENYPGFSSISGFELATHIYQQVTSLGVEYRNEKVISISPSKEVITDNNKYQTKSIIIATGLHPRKLHLEKEEELIGKGVSYCATCDGNFYQGLDVAIVGGGNTALEDAIYLSNICRKVYLIHRRDTFRGDQHFLDLVLKKENVVIYDQSIVKEIKGRDKLDSIVIEKKNQKIELEVAGLFIAIGQEPNTTIFQNMINLDEDGYIISDCCLTNSSGIFVAGDVRKKKMRQLVTAASDGAVAAKAAVDFLHSME